jgi:Holliday junction resolvase RusA-like endonuclease
MTRPRTRAADLLHLVLPVAPSVNRIWRRGKTRTGKATTYKDPKAERYEIEALAAMRAAGLHVNAPRFPRGDVGVVLVWYRAQRRGDADNRVKLCLDAANRVIWTDDSQVTDLRIVRRDDDPRNARIELWVMPAHQAETFQLPSAAHARQEAA